MITDIISGPEILLRGDQPQACRFCSLALPEPLEILVHHYTLHGYSVVADYVYEGVHYVEMDKDGRCSERAAKLLKKS
jgi:hypothetical protein